MERTPPNPASAGPEAATGNVVGATTGMSAGPPANGLSAEQLHRQSIRNELIGQPVSFGTTALAESQMVMPQDADCVVHPPFRAPNWVREMVNAKAENAQIAATLFERLVRGQSDLHVAQRILSDIGRRSGGGAILKRLVTQDNINLLNRRR